MPNSLGKTAVRALFLVSITFTIRFVAFPYHFEIVTVSVAFFSTPKFGPSITLSAAVSALPIPFKIAGVLSSTPATHRWVGLVMVTGEVTPTKE